MKITTLLSPNNVEELYFTNKVTVVIDVLRASSTIVTALSNGAKEVIPVSTIEFAMKNSSKESLSSLTILAGERNSQKIDGFALGNSPLEFSKTNVSGKSVVLFTTNGTKAVVKAKYSKYLLIASFLNAKAIIKEIESKEDIIILCAGNNGMFSYEDSVCAGYIINKLCNKLNILEIDDASKTCLLLYKNSKNDLTEVIFNTEHGKKLNNLGFKADIEYSVQKNLLEVIPVFSAGSIKQKN